MTEITYLGSIVKISTDCIMRFVPSCVGRIRHHSSLLSTMTTYRSSIRLRQPVPTCPQYEVPQVIAQEVTADLVANPRPFNATLALSTLRNMFAEILDYGSLMAARRLSLCHSSFFNEAENYARRSLCQRLAFYFGDVDALKLAMRGSASLITGRFALEYFHNQPSSNTTIVDFFVSVGGDDVLLAHLTTVEGYRAQSGPFQDRKRTITSGSVIEVHSLIRTEPSLRTVHVTVTRLCSPHLLIVYFPSTLHQLYITCDDAICLYPRLSSHGISMRTSYAGAHGDLWMKDYQPMASVELCSSMEISSESPCSALCPAKRRTSFDGHSLCYKIDPGEAIQVSTGVAWNGEVQAICGNPACPNFEARRLWQGRSVFDVANSVEEIDPYQKTDAFRLVQRLGARIFRSERGLHQAIPSLARVRALTAASLDRTGAVLRGNTDMDELGSLITTHMTGHDVQLVVPQRPFSFILTEFRALVTEVLKADTERRRDKLIQVDGKTLEGLEALVNFLFDVERRQQALWFYIVLVSQNLFWGSSVEQAEAKLMEQWQKTASPYSNASDSALFRRCLEEFRSSIDSGRNVESAWYILGPALGMEYAFVL